MVLSSDNVLWEYNHSIWYQYNYFEKKLAVSIKSLKAVYYLWLSNSDSGNLS